MDIIPLINRLTHHAAIIHELAAGVTAEDARWRPNEASWSLVEVISHLYDEEREDFRVRLDITLHRPEEPFPPIDPERWVMERAYRERDLFTALDGFLHERKKSLTWLRGLKSPNWHAEHATRWGSIRAGDLLAAWVDHDLHHLRQMVEWHHARLTVQVSPYSTRYAGQW